VDTTSLIYNTAPFSFEIAVILLRVLLLYVLIFLFQKHQEPKLRGKKKSILLEQKRKSPLKECWLELVVFMGSCRL
jgi:hypothetical protein